MRKKIFISFFMIIVTVVLWNTTVKATTYSKDNYTIDIPSSYTVEDDGEKVRATSSNDRNYIQIETSKQDYDFTITQEYVDYMVETFKEQYGSDFTLISSNVIEQNGCKGMDLKYRQNSSGIYVYVNAYQFVSDNYSYVIVFGSFDKSYLDGTEKNNIIKSFKIKDTVVNSNGLPFTDVSSSAWYRGAVSYVYNKKIILGTNDYTFAPDAKLTRGMLVSILWRMEGSPKVASTNSFSDVKNTSMYYYYAVNWATSNKIVSGYSNGKFGPNDNITREQLAVMLSNYCRYKGKYKATSTDLTTYSDGAKVSSFAETAMKWAVGNQVVTGSNNKLNPQGNASRAEAASMLYKYCSNIK